MSVKNVGRATPHVLMKHVAMIVCALAVGYALGRAGAGDATTAIAAEAAPELTAQQNHVFELRTYTAAEGKHDDLLARFRDHTMRIFEKHGMSNVGYWTPQDEPLAANTLIYILSHPSRDAATEAWRAFGADPEWQTVFQESRSDGPLIAGLERVFLDPTDFSPMK